MRESSFLFVHFLVLHSQLLNLNTSTVCEPLSVDAIQFELVTHGDTSAEWSDIWIALAGSPPTSGSSWTAGSGEESLTRRLLVTRHAPVGTDVAWWSMSGLESVAIASCPGVTIASPSSWSSLIISTWSSWLVYLGVLSPATLSGLSFSVSVESGRTVS